MGINSVCGIGGLNGVWRRAGHLWMLGMEALGVCRFGILVQRMGMESIMEMWCRYMLVYMGWLCWRLEVGGTMVYFIHD